MSCKKYIAEIEEAAAGSTLSVAARRHLDACAPCGAFERERNALRALVGSLGAVAAPPDFEFRLRARMHTDAGAPRRSLFGGSLAPVAGVTLAALFAVAVTASLYVRQSAGDAPAAQVESAHADGQKAEATATQEAREVAGAQAAKVEADEFENVLAVAEDEIDVTELSAGSQRASRNSSAASFEKARMTTGVGHRTATFNESRATVVSNPSAGEVALTGPTVAVPLPKSERPLKVLISDERGAARVVPIRSVSFGSQEMVARAGSQRASVGDKEVVW
ncbi:MAG TPA: hypothetical protein VFX96_12760 [Pyrinomonadaceae bacterium]|nr:hypothetical protein [Pyrinomonadaceae bacterium]